MLFEANNLLFDAHTNFMTRRFNANEEGCFGPKVHFQARPLAGLVEIVTGQLVD